MRPQQVLCSKSPFFTQQVTWQSSYSSSSLLGALSKLYLCSKSWCPLECLIPGLCIFQRVRRSKGCPSLPCRHRGVGTPPQSPTPPALWLSECSPRPTKAASTCPLLAVGFSVRFLGFLPIQQYSEKFRSPLPTPPNTQHLEGLCSHSVFKTAWLLWFCWFGLDFIVVVVLPLTVLFSNLPFHN